ncbi:hypothetical protein ACLD9I_000016 [Pseudomonas aeruginosa]
MTEQRTITIPACAQHGDIRQDLTQQAEAERPELWAVHAQGPDELYAAFSREDAEKHAAELNALPMPEGIAVGAVVVPSPWPEAEHWKYLAEQEREHVDVARAGLTQPSPALPPFAEKVLAKLRRFYDCVSDFESGGIDIGRHWLDLLTQLGLLNRVQRSPALWEISQQGEDLLEAPVAQAQHSVPLNAAALVAAEGRKYSLNAAGMFDSGAPEHAQTFAIVQLLSEFDDEEAESHWEAIMAYSDFRTSDALWRVAELLAAAPGKEGV